MTEQKSITKATTSCTECQRRKQKCSREWPCNHCQSRKISHLCQFIGKKSDRINKPSTSHKRTLSGTRKESLPKIPKNESNSSDPPELSEDEGFRAMGYMPAEGSLNRSLVAASVSDNDVGYVTSDTEKFLSSIPPKPYADSLVQYFLKEINYQYYILYPQKFSQDYVAWWTKRANGQKLDAAFTSLLLRVCACSTQSVGGELRQKLEVELGEKTQNLSQRYHEAAQQLSSKIPSRKGGLTHVQQLLLTASWFKTEALFAESWQALGSAIHKAQELGMHRDAFNKRYSDFDCEMRRRVWCILYIWDWQMSASLSRPLIINNCSLELPTGKLENAAGGSEGPPSPIAHVILQCQLIQDLSKIRGLTTDTVSSSQVLTMNQIIDEWFESFPPVYRLSNPDTQWDEEYRYVLLQRLQLQIIGKMIMFQPLKPYLTRTHNEGTPKFDGSPKNLAIDCALKLVDISHQYYDLAYPIYSKFHLVIFVMFDTAAALCSAITRDIHCNLYRRKEIIHGIQLVLGLMGQIKHLAKTAAVSYRTLSILVAKLPLLPQETPIEISQSTSNFDEKIISNNGSPGETSAIYSLTSGDTAENSFQTELKTPPLFDLPEMSFGDGYFPGMGDMSILDLGGMDNVLDWESIGLELPLGSVP